MPAPAVEVAPVHEAEERRHGDRRLGRQQLERQPPAVGLDRDLGVGLPRQRRHEVTPRDVAIVGVGAAGGDGDVGAPGGGRVGEGVGNGEPAHQVVIGPSHRAQEARRHRQAAGGGRPGDRGERGNGGEGRVVERVAGGPRVRLRQPVDVGGIGAVGEQVRRHAAHGGVGMREQLAGAGAQRRVAVGDDALQPLERLRHDAAIRIRQQRLQLGTGARRGERFRGDEMPAPVGVRGQPARLHRARRGVGLGEPDDRLAPQREEGARDPRAQRGDRDAAAARAEGSLGLHGDVHVRVGRQRRHCGRDGAVAQRREGAQDVDPHLCVAVAQQRPQPGRDPAAIKAGAVDQHGADAARGDGPHARVRVLQRVEDDRHARHRPRAAQRVDDAPAHVDVGVGGETQQRGDRGAPAQAPRLENRLGDDRRHRLAGRGEVEQLLDRPRTRVAADARESRHRLNLGVTLLVGRGGARESHEWAGGARLVEQPQTERSGRPDGRNGIGERPHEQVDRRWIADPSRGERGLAAHGRIGMLEGVAQQRGVEAARIGGGEQAGQHPHQRLVGLLREGPAGGPQPYEKKEGGATGAPGPAPSADAHSRAPECGWGCAGGRAR